MLKITKGDAGSVFVVRATRPLRFEQHAQVRMAWEATMRSAGISPAPSLLIIGDGFEFPERYPIPFVVEGTIEGKAAGEPRIRFKVLAIATSEAEARAAVLERLKLSREDHWWSTTCQSVSPDSLVELPIFLAPGEAALKIPRPEPVEEFARKFSLL